MSDHLLLFKIVRHKLTLEHLLVVHVEVGYYKGYVAQVRRNDYSMFMFDVGELEIVPDGQETPQMQELRRKIVMSDG